MGRPDPQHRRQRLVARHAVAPRARSCTTPPPISTGNLWFTSNVPNRNTTVGRIDTKTGAVKMFKVNGPDGLAANTHGITRDPNGIIWFNVNAGRRGLARLDPKAEKIDVHIPPTGMSPTGGAVTVDYDGQGQIWASSPDGALRFDPATEKFTEFKSVT